MHMLTYAHLLQLALQNQWLQNTNQKSQVPFEIPTPYTIHASLVHSTWELISFFHSISRIRQFGLAMGKVQFLDLCSNYHLHGEKRVPHNIAHCLNFSILPFTIVWHHFHSFYSWHHLFVIFSNSFRIIYLFYFRIFSSSPFHCICWRLNTHFCFSMLCALYLYAVFRPYISQILSIRSAFV